MQAMQLLNFSAIEEKPLKHVEIPLPQTGKKELLIKISRCGVCHTELDEIEGRLSCRLPVIPGHQIIGTVAEAGNDVKQFKAGDRVGVAWIGSACGKCIYCRSGRENLCKDFKGTGCDINGGYAEYTAIDAGFCYSIPENLSDSDAAPLLCAGAVGYRALLLSGVQSGQTLGLFGFGSSAHLIIQIAHFRGIRVFVFSRGQEHREMAVDLGAEWAGQDNPPRGVDAAIDFTPIGETVPGALKILNKGGRLVLAVIRKRNPIPPLEYTNLLWDEKEIKSVANVTRRDVTEFLSVAAQIPIRPQITDFELEKANDALLLLKNRRINGTAVLRTG